MSFSVKGRIGIVNSGGGSLKSSQTITFPSLSPKTYGASDFSLGATASSGLTVSYSSSSISVATIISGQIHIVGIGSTNITVTQAGNTHYYAATPVTHTLTVNKANQTITFGSLSSETVTSSDFNPEAMSSSGLTIVYTSSNTSVATIVGGNIHIIGVGTTNIIAAQLGNSDYNAATPVTQALTVSATNQTITFNSLSPITYGVSDYSPGATSSSGLPIAYISSNTSVAIIVANNIHVVAPGSTNIIANQAGNINYNAATPITQSLTVNLANQIIIFPTLTIQNVGSPDFSPGAISSSGLVISYTSSDSTVATIVSGNIHIVGVGNCNITATQIGNTNYNAATPIIQILTVSSSTIYVSVDTSFENIAFPIIGFYPNAYISSIINKIWNIIRPNYAVTLLFPNNTFNLINTNAGAIGQIEVTLLTGSEQLQLNGVMTFTMPTSPGTFIINYLNTSGTLTFS